MSDTLLHVNSTVLRKAADAIRDKGVVKMTNGVPVVAKQLEVAAQILENGDKCWTNFDPTPLELPGFIHAENQETADVLVFDVGILSGGGPYRIKRDGTTDRPIPASVATKETQRPERST